LFFKRGDPKEFLNSKNIIPIAILTFGILLLPLFFGLLLVLNEFSLANISLVVIYLIIVTVPTFFLKRNTCAQCEQGKLGCPAIRTQATI
jgi:4-hydroxybenzoate polyprenyltransferase